MLPPRLKKVGAILLSIVASSVQEEVEDQILIIPDAGRRFTLGALYDARTDTYIPGRLWNMNKIMVDHYRYETPASMTSINFNTESTLSSRLDFLDVDVHAKFKYASVGLTMDIEGAFKYLSDKPTSSKSIKYAAKFSTRSKRETLDILNNKMVSMANRRIFGGADGNCDKCKIATHVVSSITWGADAVVSFESHYANAAEKEKIIIGLEGLLDIKASGIQAAVKGDLNITNFVEEVKEKITVKIFGDLKMDRPVPQKPEEAVKFIRELPLITDTLVENNGIGVPMEITLTPLSWIDSNAAKLTRRLSSDLLERLMKVYDSLEKSESRILDTLATRYDGFIVWKASMDSFYKLFKEYQISLSQIMNKNAMDYTAGEVDLSYFTTIQDEYWDLNNHFNIISVIEECEKREDEIGNLLALASQFIDAGIIFARHLSDFYAPTFDSRYDRVYGLVIVGTNPHKHRDTISIIRDFVELASSHKHEGSSDPKMNHCLAKNGNVHSGSQRCIETEAFVTIHFDSYCESLCDKKFCIPDSDYTGSCDVGNVTAVEHHIDNNPFGDCWCHDPQTQIVQFVRSGSPERLTDDLPRVPKTPVLANITGEAEDEMEKFGTNQEIELKITDVDPNTRNFKVTVEYAEAKVSPNGDISFSTHQKVIYTKSSQGRVYLNKLLAGQIYDLYVAGKNAVGLGQSTEKYTIQIGHRMTDMDVVIEGHSFSKTLEIPSWLPADMSLTLSLRSFSRISTITINTETSVNSVDVWEYDSHNSDQFVECKEIASSYDGAECFMKDMISLSTNKRMELRVWDDTNLLIAKNPIDILAASVRNCAKYGNDPYFCPLSTPSKCVTSCTQCVPEDGGESFLFDSTCRSSSCPADKLYCPLTATCVDNGHLSKSCSVNCHKDSETRKDDKDIDQCYIPGCQIKVNDDERLNVKGGKVVEEGSNIDIACRTVSMSLPTTISSQKLIHGICITGAKTVSASASASGSPYSHYTMVPTFVNGVLGWNDRLYYIDGVANTPCHGGMFLKPHKYLFEGDIDIKITAEREGTNDLQICIFTEVGATGYNRPNDGGFNTLLPLAGATTYEPSFAYYENTSNEFVGSLNMHCFDDTTESNAFNFECEAIWPQEKWTYGWDEMNAKEEDKPNCAHRTVTPTLKNPNDVVQPSTVSCDFYSDDLYRYVDNEIREYPNQATLVSWKDINWERYTPMDCSTIKKGAVMEMNLPEGATVKCHNNVSQLYRHHMNQLNRLPSDEIADSWDPNWRSTVKTIDCTGLPIGSDKMYNFGDTVHINEKLYANNKVWSKNKAYYLMQQDDGNLCVFSASDIAQWCSERYDVGNAPYYTILALHSSWFMIRTQDKDGDLIYFKPIAPYDLDIDPYTYENKMVMGNDGKLRVHLLSSSLVVVINP